MPNPENGCDDIAKIFNKHIFPGKHKKAGWVRTTALMGVHTIGRAHKENSGYEGSWTRPNSTGVFNNDYYKEMLVNGWGPKQVSPGKN